MRPPKRSFLKSLADALLIVSAGVRIKSVAAGAEHSLAVSEEGEVFSWGCGGQGRLGHGASKGMSWLQQQSEAQPRVVNSLEGTPIASAAAGHMHSGVPLGWVPTLSIAASSFATALLSQSLARDTQPYAQISSINKH